MRCYPIENSEWARCEGTRFDKIFDVYRTALNDQDKNYYTNSLADLPGKIISWGDEAEPGDRIEYKTATGFWIFVTRMGRIIRQEHD